MYFKSTFEINRGKSDIKTCPNINVIRKKLFHIHKILSKIRMLLDIQAMEVHQAACPFALGLHL